MLDVRSGLEFFQSIGASFLVVKSGEPGSELRRLEQEISECRLCRLHQGRLNTVPGEGAAAPGIMFIGEGPGETEDRFGRPFIGNAGQLLDRLIERLGYSRESVFIGNIVKCRPPNNREPAPDEVAACLPYLARQIEILRPRVIVCLGKTALVHLLGVDQPISKARGRVFHYREIPVVPTFHPSYILHKKDPEEVKKTKWQVWNDMQVVLELLRTEAE